MGCGILGPSQEPKIESIRSVFAFVINVVLITSIHHPNTQSTLLRLWAVSTVKWLSNISTCLSEPTTRFPAPCLTGKVHRVSVWLLETEPTATVLLSGTAPQHRWPHSYKNRGTAWGPPAWLRPGSQNPGSLLGARQTLLPQDGWRLWKLLCFSA